MPTPKLNMTNQQFAERQKAAQQIKAGQAPAATGPGALQQQGAQTGAVNQAAQTQGMIQQAGQQAVQAQKDAQMQQIQQQEQNQMDEITAQKALADQQRQLEAFAQDIGSDMMAERRDLAKKKSNTAFNNERQLMDWITANAENEQDFAAKVQEIQQASQKKIQTMDIIQKRLMLEEERISKGKMNAAARATKKKIAVRRAELQRQIERERKKAAKKGGMFKAAMGALQVGAGAALAIYGGPAGMAAGSSIAAQGAGQMAGGASEAGVI